MPQVPAGPPSTTPPTPEAVSAPLAPPAPPAVAPAHGHGPPQALGPLALGALGVVFGDIGTSPLYSLQECVSGAHGAGVDQAGVYGVLSLIVWSLMLVVTTKYLAFLMQADNRGEGGIMALLALLPEKMRKGSPGQVTAMGLLVIIGASLLYGDGVITPAISVLSAVEGLGEITSALTAWVVPITCLILLGLFSVQSKGTGPLATAFGPIMLVWFSTIGALGLWQVVHQPGVLAALSPGFAVAFFQDHGWSGIRVLGAVVLTVTGGEALYADMGHFGRKPIQAAWLVVALPALVLCYFGQGALILAHPELAMRPFFSLVPAGWPTVALVLLATAATVIASQSLISGVFSLTRQAVQLGYFPRVAVHHTSHDAEGQIYLPVMNWGLAVGCVGLVLWAGHSEKLAAAFGLAVSGTMAITSVVYYAVVRETWGWSRLRALPLLIGFLSFDIPFLVANCFKFFDGGYVPFAIGFAFAIVMVIWLRGRGLLAQFLSAQSLDLDGFVRDAPGFLRARAPGVAVCMASQVNRVPPVLARMVRRFGVTYETVLVLNVEILPRPTVPDEERADIEALGNGFFRVALRFGYMQTPDVPAGLLLALANAGLPGGPTDVVYFLGRERFDATAKGEMGPISETIFAFLANNAGDATAHFGLPSGQVVELGDRIDL